MFHLVDSWQEEAGTRTVFKFRLQAVEEEERVARREIHPPRRHIPTEIKQQVWKRDRGRCVRCGATENLHFDHDIPFSKGGSSFTVRNVQILCARHNLKKGALIE